MESEYAPGEIIVKFNTAASADQIASVNSRCSASLLYTSPHAGYSLISVPPDKTVSEMVELYNQDPNVEYAEPNYIIHAHWTPNDPYYNPYQWHLDNNVYGGINMEAAWEFLGAPGTPGASAVVAVLDSGVAYENYGAYCQAPDLAGTCFVSGYDFINEDAHPNDDNGHGTHVTGTIAQSTNNGIGVAGIAFDACIMPIKVFDSAGSGTHTDFADGVYYAVDNGADIINYSGGGNTSSTTMENACAYAYNHGVTIIASAGNDKLEGNPPNYPAAYDDYVIAVGATRYDETRSPYSNTGSYLDIAAPGGDVTVDQNGDGYIDGILQQTINLSTKDPCDFGYWFMQGTSMAAPHVSGVAALLVANGTTGPDNIRQALESTAEDHGTAGWDEEYGWGIVDAYAALNYNFTKTLNISTSVGGTVTNPGIGSFGPYTLGQVVNISAVPNPCYYFVNWSGDTTTITNVSSPSTTITMNDSYSITANFTTDPFSGGDGSQGNPYLIQDVCDLQNMNSDLSAHYALANDIDASATSGWNGGDGFMPVGNSSNRFTGSFDGRGYAISGLYINRPSTDHIGLFSYIGTTGMAINVSLVNVNITGGQYCVGGLVGDNYGSISNSYATGNVSGNDDIGGLVGKNIGGTVSNSYAAGHVSGSGYNTGGLVGNILSGTVSNSYSTANVSGTWYVAGLIGTNRGNVLSSYSTGNVSASGGLYAGGLIGYNYEATTSNSYATGNVSGNGFVGGLVGANWNSTVNNSYAIGFVNGSTNVGGLVGYNSSGTVFNSFWDTETSGQSSSSGGTGKTTAEMKAFSTFFNAGWDLICESDNGTDDIWGMDQSGADNNGYPFLSWQGLTHNVSFTLAYSTGAGGSINGTSPQTVNCSDSGTAVEAVPDACYHFVNWSDSSIQNPRTDTIVTGDLTVTANFAIDTFTMTYNAGANGSVNGTTPQTVDCSSNGSAVTAVPDPCYYFVNWSDSSTENPRTDTNVTGDITVTANFAPTGATYSLMINSSEYGNVSIPGEGTFGTYNCGDIVNIAAAPDAGYRFVNWSGNTGTIADAESSSTTITMYDNYSITANFGLIPEGFYGDANGDEACDISDYSYVRRMIFGKEAFNPGGDGNMDGMCDISDYSFIRRMIFGKESITDKYEISYDFLSGEGSNKWAVRKTITSTPPTDHFDNESGWTAATSTDYDDIALTDDNVWTINGTSGNYSALQCKFTVVNNPAEITSIGVTLNGSSNIDAGTLRFYAWNFNSGTWTQIGTGFTMTTTIDSYSSWTAWGKMYENYIDGNQYMYILAVLNTANADLNVDYIRLSAAYP